MEELVSIIVPVYNVERYLSECIESVLGQDYSNWELILSNDGSSDSSPAICDEYALRDSRIKVIHHENGGSNAARRMGLEIASGDYVAFMDSDDTLPKCAISTMLEYIKGDISIVCGCFDTDPVKPKDVVRLSPIQYRKVIVGGERPSLCGKLYKREVIDSNYFMTPREFNLGEDWLVNVKIAFGNDIKACIIPDIVYNYRQVATSQMHSSPKFPAYELVSYKKIISAIPEYERGKYITCLISDKIKFLTHIICYCGIDPNREWIGSEFYNVLLSDISNYNIHIPYLKKSILFKRMNPKARKGLILVWKALKKLKVINE